MGIRVKCWGLHQHAGYNFQSTSRKIYSDFLSESEAMIVVAFLEWLFPLFALFQLTRSVLMTWINSVCIAGY